MKKWKKWHKKERLPIEQLPVHDCPNCGTSFQGYFCPSCGQSTTEFDRPFGFVFYDFIGNFFSFDSRFLKTFQYLIFRPGFLSSEFLAGRRERYAPPIRTYIFLSFILFLLVQILADKALDKPIGDKKELSSIENEIAGSDKKELFHLDLNTANPDSALRDSSILSVETIGDASSISAGLESYAAQLNQKIQKETDPEKKAEQERLAKLLGSPHSLASAFLKYLSWAFFIMLPIFASLLSLLYIRKGLHYIRHLVFAVHIHSFLFLLNLILVVWALIFWSVPGWAFLVAFIGMQIYVFAALKHFYRQGFRKTFLKYSLLGILYFTLLMFVFIGVTFLVFSEAF